MGKARTNRVLVAGTGRSGTTWVGRVLGSAADTVYINEPDNIGVNHGEGGQDVTFGFGPYPILHPQDDAPQYAALWRMAFSGRVPLRLGVGRRVGRAGLRLPRPIRDPLMGTFAGAMERFRTPPPNVVVKSTMTAFCLEWIDAHYHPRVVILQRDPLNVVSSWLAWKVTGKDLHTRRAVTEQFVEPYGLPAAPTNESRAALTAWYVGLVTTTLSRLAAQHPEWSVTTHESLCAAPEAEFRALFRDLGLRWSDEAAAFLQRGYLLPTFAKPEDEAAADQSPEVTQAQPDRWKERLDESQLDDIKRVLDQFPTRGWVRQPQAVSLERAADVQPLTSNR